MRYDRIGDKNGPAKLRKTLVEFKLAKAVKLLYAALQKYKVA